MCLRGGWGKGDKERGIFGINIVPFYDTIAVYNGIVTLKGSGDYGIKNILLNRDNLPPLKLKVMV